MLLTVHLRDLSIWLAIMSKLHIFFSKI